MTHHLLYSIIPQPFTIFNYFSKMVNSFLGRVIFICPCNFHGQTNWNVPVLCRAENLQFFLIKEKDSCDCKRIEESFEPDVSESVMPYRNTIEICVRHC